MHNLMDVFMHMDVKSQDFVKKTRIMQVLLEGKGMTKDRCEKPFTNLFNYQKNVLRFKDFKKFMDENKNSFDEKFVQELADSLYRRSQKWLIVARGILRGFRDDTIRKRIRLFDGE